MLQNYLKPKKQKGTNIAKLVNQQKTQSSKKKHVKPKKAIRPERKELKMV
jgi:hypothetical protein